MSRSVPNPPPQTVGKQHADMDPSKGPWAALAPLAPRLRACSASRALGLAAPPAGDLGPAFGAPAGEAAHLEGLRRLAERCSAQSDAPYCVTLGGGGAGASAPGAAGGGGAAGEPGAADGGGGGADGAEGAPASALTVLLPAELAALFSKVQ